MCYNYKYDGFGRLTEVTINGKTAVTYNESKDADGNTVYTEALAGGETFEATNDAEGKLMQVKLGDTVVKSDFSYDELKRCTGYTSDGKDHTFVYDSEDKKRNNFSRLQKQSVFLLKKFKDEYIIKS